MEIVVTADRTSMNSYHDNDNSLSFGTTATPNLLPDRFYKQLFLLSIRTKGVPVEDSWEVRRIESWFLNEGYKVLTVDSDHLKPYIRDAKVLGIHMMNPYKGNREKRMARTYKVGVKRRIKVEEGSKVEGYLD